MSDQNQNRSIEEDLEQYLAQEKAKAELSRRNDLLSQIAQEDIQNEKKTKQRKIKADISFSKLFMVSLMRGTLLYDTTKHKYSGVFNAFSTIWGIFTILLYLGGIAAVFIFGYAYMNYPLYIQSYFSSNNIHLSNWKLTDYTLSRIELEDLKDTDNAYEIKKAIIRSDFSDFLNKRIKSITLDGVTIEVREKGEQFEIGQLGEILVKLNQAAQSGYQIGSVSISNATLILKGAKYELPIQFSMTGFYERNTSISVSFKIKQPHINISGMFAISGTGDTLNWSIENLSGNLSFPNRQPENVAASFKIKTVGLSVNEVNGSVSLTYGKNSKTAKIDLKKSSELFRGNIDLSFVNKEVAQKTDETKTVLNLNFEGLDIKNISSIKSDKPIRFNLQSLAMKDFNLTNASGLLQGSLECKDFICSYQVDKNIPVTIQSLKTFYQGATYTSKGRINLTVKPNNRPNLIIDNDLANVNLSLGDVVFNGTRNTNVSEIKMTAQNMSVSGKISDKTGQSAMAVTADNISYESSEVSLKNANVSIVDIWNESTDFSLTAQEVGLKNYQLVKVPFELNMKRREGMTQADLSMLNNTIHAKFNGTSDLLAGVFQGVFTVKPFAIQNATQNLSAVSNLFPNYLQNVSGQVALYGKINWRNEKQITGPFYLSLENVNFNLGSTTVKDLNTVLVLQSLAPFVSASNQEVFIGEISNVLPLNNVKALLKFDNQMLRLSTLDVQVAGVSLGLENTIIPYRSNSTVLYLKNADADLEPLNNHLKIDNLKIAGKAQVTLPLEVRQNTFAMNSSEIKFNNATFNYTGDNKRIKQTLFTGGSEYILRSGSIMFTQTGPDILDAYLNLDGRTPPSPAKVSYKETISLNVPEIIAPVKFESVPESIRQKQDQIKHASTD